MKQKQANLLMEVYNLMIDLPKEAEFNLRVWARTTEARVPNSIKKAIDCGTSACAVGWAVIALPSWKKHFTFNDSDDLEITDKKIIAQIVDQDADELFEGIAVFLGIEESESDYMFDPCHYMNTYPTREDVIEHITKVLDDNGFEVYDRVFYY